MACFPDRANMLVVGVALGVAGGVAPRSLCAQFPTASAASGAPVRSAEQDHQEMMNQLGVRALRPGPSGNESAPNHANYDESLANPFPNLPDVLTLRNGRKITTAAQWA